MKKRVNSLVSKVWAAEAKRLLTGNYQDITSVYIRLLTHSNAEQQQMKSEAARERVASAYKALTDGLRYGWHFGINNQPVKKRHDTVHLPCRRVRALIPVAIECGWLVGQVQHERIKKAHGSHLRNSPIGDQKQASAVAPS